VTTRRSLSTLLPTLVIALALSGPLFAAAPTVSGPHAVPAATAPAAFLPGALPTWSSAVLAPAEAAQPAQSLDRLLGASGLACRSCDFQCTPDNGCFCNPVGHLLCCQCT
jgi:hypothetical protein